MKLRNIIAAAALLFAATTTASVTLPPDGEWIKPTDKSIVYVGRVSFRNPDAPMFNYPGTEIRAGFTGTSLKMVCKPMTGYFMVSIDGKKAFKVGFNAPKDSIVNLATALSPGKHTVRAMYVIEGLDRKGDFRGFILDEGCKLFKPALPKHRIEFIGNSITCGFGNESLRKDDPFEFESENHYLTYASIVSDKLDALHTAIARSGIGVYRNAGGPIEGSADVMAAEFPYTIYNDHSERWDFSRFIPEVVCINLGTNDFSGPGYKVELYDKAYRDFLSMVRSHYRDVPIVLLTGSMLQGETNELQKKTLDRIADDFKKVGDNKIYRLDFSPQKGDLGYGACWHPSYKQHQKMADELYPLLKKLLK